MHEPACLLSSIEPVDMPGKESPDTPCLWYNVPLKSAVVRRIASQGGGLGCNWAETRVMSLAWNDEDQVLYIGGELYLSIRTARWGGNAPSAIQQCYCGGGILAAGIKTHIGP